MRALLLAAGRATRLGELSRSTPKCLHQLGHETLLDRLVSQLSASGVSEFLINTHHLAGQIRDHVASAPWGGRATLVHEEELLGTLRTLKANVDFFQGDTAWVLHADNFISGPLLPLLRGFEGRPPNVWGSMLTFEVDDPSDFGVVDVDSTAVVTSFAEKVATATSRKASAATFIFDRRVLNLVEDLPNTCRDISQDLVPRLIGRLVAVPATGSVIDIGTPDRLAAARLLARELESSD